MNENSNNLGKLKVEIVLIYSAYVLQILKKTLYILYIYIYILCKYKSSTSTSDSSELKSFDKG